jgi:type III secretion protein S
MLEPNIVYLVKQMLWLTFILSLPVVAVTAAIGLIIGFIQALTQIQDQTFAYLFKLFGAVIVMGITTSWMGDKIIAFTNQCFQLFGTF